MAEASEDKDATMRSNAVHEILDSEKRYLQSLTVLKDHFYTPLTNSGHTLKPILTAQEISKIFQNVTDIQSYSMALVEKLDLRIETEKSLKIGDIFNFMTWGFQMYQRYAAQYEVAIAELKRVEEQPAFKTFLAEALAHEDVHGQALLSFLIMPVQRVPRYRMMIAEVVKYTKPEDEDYKELKAVLSQIEEMATSINEEIRSRENADKLRSLTLYFNSRGEKIELFKPGRVFLKEGQMTKICRKSHKKYLFVLCSDLLLYKNEQDLKSKTTQQKVVAFKALPDTEKYSNAIEVRSDKKSFIVYPEDAASKDSWLEKFGELNLDEDSAAAPVWQHDKDQKACTLCSVKFTMTKRRHHCRNCGILVCQNCSRQKFDLPHEKKARVCDECYRKLAGQSASALPAEPETPGTPVPDGPPSAKSGEC